MSSGVFIIESALLAKRRERGWNPRSDRIENDKNSP